MFSGRVSQRRRAIRYQRSRLGQPEVDIIDLFCKIRPVGSIYGGTGMPLGPRASIIALLSGALFLDVHALYTAAKLDWLWYLFQAGPLYVGLLALPMIIELLASVLAASAAVSLFIHFNARPIAPSDKRGLSRIHPMLRAICVLITVAVAFRSTSVTAASVAYRWSFSTRDEMCKAAAREDFNTVDRLLRSGADANYSCVDGTGDISFPETPLTQAVKGGGAQTVEALLKRGANPNEAGGTHFPLEVAAASNRVDLGKLLVDYGADVNRGIGMNPLSVAAASGNVEFVAFLIRRGADVKRQCSDGKTAREWAQSEGHDNVERMISSRYH